MFRNWLGKSLEEALKKVFITLVASPATALLLMVYWNIFLPGLLPQLFNFRHISYYESWLLTLLFSTIL